MTNKKQEKIQHVISNPINKAILSVLKDQKRLNPGDIVKSLKITPSKGLMHIIELKQLGFIDYVDDTSLLELNNTNFSN